MPATTAQILRSMRDTRGDVFDELADWLEGADDDDAMDAPSDWDSGSVTFDPWVG